MSNGSSNESSRSPVWRLEDWAEWVEFNGERWERAEAISNIKGNEAVECLMSVFLVATMVREEEEHGIEDYNRSMVVEDVAFVDVGEAFEWANEMLDDDFRVVEVSLKGQL